MHHLRKLFERCREYGISLNPKNSTFGVDQGKLLSHIVSKDGICVDLTKVESIRNISFPDSRKALQSLVKSIL
jgi:hypothetical protein